MRRFGNADFGAVTLIGRDSRNQTSLNGLPATPSSTRILGRFGLLTTLSHPNLCSYVEVIRSTTLENAVFLISEHYRHTLQDEITKHHRLEKRKIIEISVKMLSAICYLHQRRVVVGYFSLGSILLVPKSNEVRLSQYALNYLSGGGLDVEGCVGCAWYLAPERLVRPRAPRSDGVFSCPGATRASDIWALGIALLEMNVGILLSDIWGLKQIFAVIRECIRRAVRGSALSPLLDAIKLAKPECVNFELDSDLEPILTKMLSVKTSDRPRAEQLLKEFSKLGDFLEVFPFIGEDCSRDGYLRNSLCEVENLSETIAEMKERISKEDAQILSRRPIQEAFFLWKLCGSSVENILLNHGIIHANSSVNTLPLIVLDDCFMYGNSLSRRYTSIFDIFILPSNNLKDRMASIDSKRFLMSFEMNSRNNDNSNVNNNNKNSFKKENNPNGLSLIVKERDVEYQMYRMFILSRLLAAYPFRERLLLHECGADVPPLYRAHLWAAFLNVSPAKATDRFRKFDTHDEHPSDRQLMVDIPRCHQYDELMASPKAHYKLKRILKAWLLAHQNYVYWQGLDSLAAPFLVLHFNRLPVAFACLEAFISNYLHNFFLKDNSAIIQEYLAVFNHLLAYVDASLYWHLNEMDFTPELFAIPWFLTCFAHVLPLHKLFHVWDVLLLCDCSFPLFIGVSIMSQMRARLITATFNDAILMFSDLPDLNVERIVEESVALYREVPRSCTYREHASTVLCCGRSGDCTGGCEFGMGFDELSRSDLDSSTPATSDRFGPKQKEPKTYKMTTHLSVSELKQCTSPRISAEHLEEYMQKASVLIVDVRAQAEFCRGALNGSINMPWTATSTLGSGSNSGLSSTGAVGVECLDGIRTALNKANEAKHPIVIVGDAQMRSANEIARRCVKEGFNRVCVLDGGISSVRSMQHLFSVPF